MLGATTVTATRHTYPTEATAVRSRTRRWLVEVGALAAAAMAVWKPFVQDELRVSRHHIIVELANLFVPMLAIKVLSTVVERGHEKEEVTGGSEASFGEVKKSRSNALSARLGCNRYGGDVRRSCQTRGCNENEAGGPLLVTSNEELGAGTAQRLATAFEIAAQGNPGLARRHHAGAPFIVARRGERDMNRGSHISPQVTISHHAA
jgi:hypothetical protein